MSDEPTVPGRKIGPYQQSLLESRVRRREEERKAAQLRQRRLRVAAVVAVTALIAVAIGGVGWWLGRPTGATPAADCATTTPVRIWASPSAKPALEAAVKAYVSTDAGHCLDASIDARTPAEAVAQLTADKPGRADAWVPDSTVWVQRANAVVKPAVAAPAAFATSPLVLAASAAAADKIQAGTDWKDLLTSSNGVRLSDPAATTAGLLAIATALPSLGADAHALLTQLAQDVAPSTTDVVAASAKDGKAGAALAAEADIIVHNRADSEHRLSAVVPGNQTLSFQYSLVGLATNPDTKKAVDGLRSFLASKDAAAILAANGLRPMADQKAVPTQTGAVTADFTAAVPSDQVLKTASDSWQAATIDFRLLAVIDVSGSMRERVAGSTRIGLTAQAAQKALGALPKSTELGLWAFSVGRGPGGLDYKELAPIGPLDDEQQLGRLSQAVTTLPRQVGGGTALYDTIWGAYQRVLDGYDADRVNAVVILTDGRNDDPNGISLSQLKARLATADPKRPVAITTIGIGPAVDGEALSQISEMMHSSYYPATQPEDISQVLAQALTDHTCTDGVCA